MRSKSKLYIYRNSKSHTKMLIRTQWYNTIKYIGMEFNFQQHMAWYSKGNLGPWENKCSPSVFASSLWIYPPFQSITQLRFFPANLIVQYPSHGLPLQTLGTNKRYELPSKYRSIIQLWFLKQKRWTKRKEKGDQITFVTLLV